jgi:hypothetical protein
MGIKLEKLEGLIVTTPESFELFEKTVNSFFKKIGVPLNIQDALNKLKTLSTPIEQQHQLNKIKTKLEMMYLAGNSVPEDKITEMYKRHSGRIVTEPVAISIPVKKRKGTLKNSSKPTKMIRLLDGTIVPKRAGPMPKGAVLVDENAS